MSQHTATAFASLVGSGGAVTFPQLTATGGSIWGVKVYTSGNLLPSSDSPQTQVVTMCHFDSVAVADAGIALDMSANATLEMSDSPSGGATTKISLWQSNFVGLKGTRYCTWQRRRDIGVAAITGIA